VKELRVIARATAADKHLLVQGLKYLNKNVAVTGDGLNDVSALNLSDVGMAMNSGSAAAKEVSSIILTQNDFEASLRAVMWGRNIFHNISRFIQFQVTVNISALVTIFVGTIVFSNCPLNAVQLLWINLIMDTFAALALSTEPPLKQVIKGKPYTDDMSILTLTVRGQIYLISLWNILVMTILMFAGGSIGGLGDYDRSTDPGDNDDKARFKRTHFTYIYNTFVFLQMFNMINCRKIGRRDFNVFESFFHNMYFLVLFAFIVVVQFLQVEWFSSLTNTEPLQRSEWGSCIAVASTSLPISAIIKLIPDDYLKKLPFINMGDEDKVMNNKLLDNYNKATGAAVQQTAVGENESALGEYEAASKPASVHN
jgi:magnesium-transporting ATPase (P-type)